MRFPRNPVKKKYSILDDDKATKKIAFFFTHRVVGEIGRTEHTGMATRGGIAAVGGRANATI
jgi:hypothetical protein